MCWCACRSRCINEAVPNLAVEGGVVADVFPETKKELGGIDYGVVHPGGRGEVNPWDINYSGGGYGCVHDCDKMSPGNYAKCGNCSVFLLCDVRYSSEICCPTGTYFDAVLGYCGPRTDHCGTQPLPVTSPEPTKRPDCVTTCQSVADGLYASCSSCSQFLVCQSGVLTIIPCPSATYYDITSKTCGSSSPTACLGKEDSPFATNCIRNCTGFPDGQYADCQSCRRFLICVRGSPNEVPCPLGALYSSRSGRCERTRDYGVCGVIKMTAPPPASVAYLRPPGPGCVYDCSYMNDGQYASCVSCASYIVCLNRRTYFFSCSYGKFYSVSMGACVMNGTYLVAPYPMPGFLPGQGYPHPGFQPDQGYPHQGAPPSYHSVFPQSFPLYVPNQKYGSSSITGPVDCGTDVLPPSPPIPPPRCITRCRGIPFGSYPNCNNCARFFVCVDGLGSSLSCPRGKFFSVRTRTCSAYDDSECGRPRGTDSCPTCTTSDPSNTRPTPPTLETVTEPATTRETPPTASTTEEFYVVTGPTGPYPGR